MGVNAVKGSAKMRSQYALFTIDERTERRGPVIGYRHCFKSG